MFDELRGLLIDRLRDIRLDVSDVVDSGRLKLMQIDPAEMSPGEFASLVRTDVEQEKATVVVIDSLNGYLNSMPHEHFLTAQLHELLSYLGQRGVATILVVGQQGIVGAGMRTPIDASYLADSIMLFRFFEARGQVHKAISVTKKRGGAHENTIREMTIDSTGVRLGGLGQAMQPRQRVFDFVILETGRSELARQLNVVRAGVRAPVVLVQVHQHVKHAADYTLRPSAR
jgi:circadian clock protein KaiC